MTPIRRWAFRPTTLLALALAPAILLGGCAKEDKKADKPKQEKAEKKKEPLGENKLRIKNRSGEPLQFSAVVGATSTTAQLEHEKDYNLNFRVDAPAPLELNIKWADGQTTSATLSTFNPGDFRKGSIKIKRHSIGEDYNDDGGKKD